MQVQQLMKQSVHSCGANDSLDTAARIMWESDCGCVPVKDGDGQLVGIITDRDICMAALHQGGPLRSLSVSSAMARTVRTCAPGDTIAAAEQVMREQQLRRLPVVDFAGQLVGMLSLNDIAVEAAREKGRKTRQVGLAEVGETLSAVCQPRPSSAIAA